jgi:hypothetical protein
MHDVKILLRMTSLSRDNKNAIRRFHFFTDPSLSTILLWYWSYFPTNNNNNNRDLLSSARTADRDQQLLPYYPPSYHSNNNNDNDVPPLRHGLGPRPQRPILPPNPNLRGRIRHFRVVRRPESLHGRPDSAVEVE